ncbi:DNA-binding transcriptional regulator, MarR family [Bryocella elongata]|uniref:DNA-binding transcriptional regulator, MarR family n=1 Tax=Bryocella elongata TaxID=863522 RepID=A0A1H5SDR3_9BACT|nr:MarR family transcriptional regulator [Bryocella elongata]SEF48776.1 DNA-binding transcriptional regulator, MarR family [Bryocella elongata]
MNEGTITNQHARKFQTEPNYLPWLENSRASKNEATSSMDTNNSNGTYLSRLRTLAEFRFQLRKFLSFSEMASERAGIAAQQYQLMQVIASMPEGQKASIGYLAERMILRHNSMVELVDRAERKGLVRREHDEKDLRRSLVLLTQQGEELLHRLVVEHLKELGPKSEMLMHALHELQIAGQSQGTGEAESS